MLGGAGDDQINVQGALDLVEGGDGNDYIHYNSSTEGGGLTLSGGAGDDVIIHLTLNSTPEHLNSLTIDAGEGDDRLLSSANIGPDADNSGDMLTGGSGADSFELTFHHPDLTEPSRDAGIVTTITDFDPAEDSLLLVQDFESSQESRVSLPSPARSRASSWSRQQTAASPMSFSKPPPLIPAVAQSQAQSALLAPLASPPQTFKSARPICPLRSNCAQITSGAYST
ncbi:hypothetical protein OAI26_05690 [Sulfitobacter sp.]|nr:hypothetical protein [Sulfitobacter sp.]